MLGARPARSRPEARAAWDYSCRCADRYLARRLRELHDQALADLDERPHFDPAELERARQRLAGSRAGHADAGPASLERLLVQRLERAAATHRAWRRAAADALDIRRQIIHERQRRSREHSIRPPALRLVR